MKLYHISHTPNLKEIEPHISTHGKNYVYAIEYLPLGLFFGIRGHGDFDGILSGRGKNKEHLPYFSEAYEGALNLYKGQKCYVYEVDSKYFSQKTSWSEEYVSEKPVKVLNCRVVEDILSEMEEYEREGKIKLNRYSLDEQYQTLMNNYLKERIEMYGIWKNPKTEIYKFCEEKFPQVLKEVEKTHAVEKMRF